MADGSSNDTDVSGDQCDHQVAVSPILNHVSGQTALVDHTTWVMGLCVPHLTLCICSDVDVRHNPHHDFGAVALAQYHLVLLAVSVDAQIWGLEVQVHVGNW